MYRLSEDYYQEDRYGKIKMPTPEQPKSFIARVHAGDFGRGYGTIAEAIFNRRSGDVVMCAENGRYYSVVRWVKGRYWRYVNGASGVGTSEIAGYEASIQERAQRKRK